MSAYQELLKRPEWKKRRAEIIELAGCRCEDCGRCLVGCEVCDHHESFVKQLEVHHRHYVRGRKPWEYPDVAFLCICRDCHEERTLTTDVIKMALGLLSCRDQELLLIKAKSLLRQACKNSREVGETIELDNRPGAHVRNPYFISESQIQEFPDEIRGYIRGH